MTLSMGCASQVAKPESPRASRAGGADAQALTERYQAQAQRVAELEARVALLEAESRAQRSQAPTRPTETVHIGKRRRAEQLEDDGGEQEIDRRPVIRLHDSAPAPFSPPPPPPGVSASLSVVPLPHERSQQALAQAQQADQQDARGQYRAALRLLRQQRYGEALAAFDAFLARYAAHPLSDNAVYWRGEAHYAERRYAQALEEFSTVLKRFPDSNKAADSLLKLGLCHLRLGNRAEAARHFERVRTQYPNSVAAQSAPREGSS